MASSLRSIGWSLYAAASWTWCIGMFLPVLLMQWFGWSGFLLVAIPNCLGAAAMGLFLGSREASRRFCKRHPVAIAVFIDITIAFHLLFLFIAALWLAGEDDLPAAGVVWAIVAAYGLSWMPRVMWPWMAVVAFAVGGLVVLECWNLGGASGWTGTRPPIDVLWFAPVFSLGFVLCPWLDGPFHRARQETDGPAAFLLLGPLFLCMLLVTASYWWTQPGSAREIVLVWIFGQSVFTIAANLKERRTLAGVNHAYPNGIRIGIVLGVLLCTLPLAGASWPGAVDSYIAVLSAYGIAFPAVILGWCLPKAPTLTTKGASRFTILLLVAGAFGIVGFITGPAWVAVIPALLVLTAPWITKAA
ncbi:MAG: hypothetical protein QF561_03575 [Phycisphaerales bacterium]|jgi:hypothetical protein|nr:hypothetical protein [Phycisphaerales bacterium]